MKKVLSIALTLILVLGMGSAAFAGDKKDPDYKDSATVKINKKIKVENYGTVHPGEEFTFTIGNGVVTDGTATTAPAFDPDAFTINIGQDGKYGSADIALPEFNQVGVYTYPVNEVAGDTAGMHYDSGDYSLVVTVINDPSGDGFMRVLTLADGKDVKTDKFMNKFYAGDLKIHKVIAGNYSDPDDEFEVTVTVTPDEGKVINDGPIEWGAGTVTEVDGVYTAVYTIKGGDKIHIENLPYNVSYVVEETNKGEYEVAYDNATGDIEQKYTETTITNTRDTEISTGVVLNSLPYILILAIAGIGLVAFAARRRLSIDE